jgi:hypothetical protein
LSEGNGCLADVRERYVLLTNELLRRVFVEKSIDSAGIGLIGPDGHI